MKGALSRIHLSIDVWTSPSRIPILGICAHFLDNSLCMRHPLLALKYLPDRHTGAAIAQVIKEVMKVYEMVERWGVLVADNATNNDTCCEALVEQLLPDEDCKTARRARCFGHMVNIAAKAFIYGVQSEGFLAEADQIVTLSNRDQTAVAREMALWRQKGSFGKFHNVVKHIRASYIREEQF